MTIHGIDKTSVVRDFDGEDVESHGPTGTAVWRVSLSLAADADQVLRGCQLEVEDTEGRRYLFGSASTTPTDVKASPCLNPHEEGPEGDFFGTGPSTPDSEPTAWGQGSSEETVRTTPNSSMPLIRRERTASDGTAALLSFAARTAPMKMAAMTDMSTRLTNSTISWIDMDFRLLF